LSDAVGEPSQDPAPRRLRAVFLNPGASDEAVHAAYDALMTDEPSPIVVEFRPGTRPPHADMEPPPSD
jgi:hypothetical protein